MARHAAAVRARSGQQTVESSLVTRGVEFADDHRAFLAAGLPLNKPFTPEPHVTYAWEKPWPGSR